MTVPLTGIISVEFVPGMTVPLTGIISVVVLFVVETSVDSVSSAGVEEDEVEPTEASVLEVVSSDVSVSSAGVEEDEVSSEVVG